MSFMVYWQYCSFFSFRGIYPESFLNPNLFLSSLVIESSMHFSWPISQRTFSKDSLLLSLKNWCVFRAKEKSTIMVIRLPGSSWIRALVFFSRDGPAWMILVARINTSSTLSPVFDEHSINAAALMSICVWIASSTLKIYLNYNNLNQILV